MVEMACFLRILSFLQNDSTAIGSSLTLSLGAPQTHPYVLQIALGAWKGPYRLHDELQSFQSSLLLLQSSYLRISWPLMLYAARCFENVAWMRHHFYWDGKKWGREEP